MKRFLITLIFLAVVSDVRAEPMGSGLRIDLMFEAATVVCTCKLLASEIVSEQPVQTPANTRRIIRGTLEVEDGFKPSTLKAGDRLTVRFERRFGEGSVSGDPLLMEPGETAIVFLKATPDGSYGWLDNRYGANKFYTLPELPKASSGIGLTKLESALIAILECAGPRDDNQALLMLNGFPTLSREGLSRLARFASSARPSPAFGAMRLLLRTKSPEGVEILKQYLDEHGGDKQAIPDWSMPYIGEIRDPCALPTLESLTRSKYVSVRIGAIDALRGIRSPSSVPVLIARLDDPNERVRWLAILALADTVGFAPPWEAFKDDPGKYVNLWKTWWSEQQGALPQPMK